MIQRKCLSLTNASHLRSGDAKISESSRGITLLSRNKKPKVAIIQGSSAIKVCALQVQIYWFYATVTRERERRGKRSNLGPNEGVGEPLGLIVNPSWSGVGIPRSSVSYGLLAFRAENFPSGTNSIGKKDKRKYIATFRVISNEKGLREKWALEIWWTVWTNTTVTQLDSERQ